MGTLVEQYLIEETVKLKTLKQSCGKIETVNERSNQCADINNVLIITNIHELLTLTGMCVFSNNLSQ